MKKVVCSQWLPDKLESSPESLYCSIYIAYIHSL